LSLIPREGGIGDCCRLSQHSLLLADLRMAPENKTGRRRPHTASGHSFMRDELPNMTDLIWHMLRDTAIYGE
jgi:hypothetical protein